MINRRYLYLLLGVIVGLLMISIAYAALSQQLTLSVNKVTPTKPTSTTCGTASGANMVCGNITYRVTTNSAGTTIAKSSNTSVAAGGTKTLYLVVRYTGTDLATSAVTQSGAKFTLPFNQA